MTRDGEDVLEQLRARDAVIVGVEKALGLHCTGDLAADVAKVVKLSAPQCEYCDKLATCFGRYEDTEYGYACDDHCGHGCEDGHCDAIEDVDLVELLREHVRRERAESARADRAEDARDEARQHLEDGRDREDDEGPSYVIAAAMDALRVLGGDPDARGGS